MRLRTQFLISLIVFAFAIAAIVGSIFIVNVNLAQIRNGQNAADSVEVNAHTLDYICVNYLLYQQNLTGWRIAVLTISDELDNMAAVNPYQRALIDRAKIDLNQVNNTFNKDVAELQSKLANQTLSSSEIDPMWINISGQVQQFTLDSHALSGSFNQEVNNINNTILLLIIALLALFGAYFTLTYRLIFKRTLPSIANLSDKTKKVSQGIKNYTEEKYPQDEIGQLSSDFDSMVCNLEETTASKQQLEKEVEERKKAESALLDAQTKLKEYASNLERIVDERTKRILESELSYRELYESFGEAFIATDWELTIIHWNRAAERVTTVKAQEALGKKIYDVLPEMMNVDVTPYFEALQQKRPTRFMMNTVSRESGRQSIFEISTYPSTQGIIIIVEDKTEEERTKRLSAIGQTAGMVGHDIRNPLQAITSDVYLIREELKGIPECKDNEAMQESLNTIEENIFYINKIISDLQDYTRPLAPANKAVNLKELLLSTLKTTNIPAIIEAKVEAPPNLIVKTDRAYLMRALSNLVTNAIQAMPKGGRLTLTGAEALSKVSISVTDTGTGIPEQAREQIFTPLFTTKAKGQGLGLAVVKRLVEGLKGNITFVSEEGKETKFIIELPKNG